MLYSMTGYGSCDSKNIHCEIRTLNHRFFTISVNIPTQLSGCQDMIIKGLREKVIRGSVTLKVTAQEKTDAVPHLDIDCAKKWYNRIEDLKKKLNIEEGVSVQTLLTFNGVLREPAFQPFLWKDIKRTVDIATREVIKARKQEGKEIQKDFQKRLTSIQKALSNIKKKVPKHIEHMRKRLKKNISSLKEAHLIVETNGKRIEQEIAFLAQRVGIEEEITRLSIYLEKFKEIISNSEICCGKNLTFLTQEMGREINTVSSKAQDAEISLLCIQIKKDLEDIREQLENVL